jgi:putative membrane protein
LSVGFPFPFEGGFGILAAIWIVVGGVFWALVLLGLFFGVRWLIRADRNNRLPPPPPPPSSSDLGAGHGTAPKVDDPFEILRARYARGEIDDEEYERRRKTLTGS